MSIAHAPAYHWSVEDYLKLGEAGVFRTEDRLELLHGEIVCMSPIGYRHAMAVTRLTKYFILHAAGRFEVRSQNPFVLDKMSLPEPDLCLADPITDRLKVHPTSEHLYLVIEVADSSVQYDRDDKKPAYAQSGIGEFWLLNLQENTLERYLDPVGATYRSVQVLGPDSDVSPLIFPDLKLRVGDYLP